MSAKITFQDIYNNELGTDKINFGSFTISLSVSAGVPAADASVGALYVDSASGSVYRKTASGGANWTQIGSITTTILVNKYPTMTINSAITSTGTDAPYVGDLVGLYGLGAWSASAALSFSRYQAIGAGSQNATIIMGGIISTTALNSTELFNGLAWSASGNAVISRLTGAGGGSQNAAFVAGGSTDGAATNTTELFNGSTWANSATLSVAKNFLSSAGRADSGLVAGGGAALSTNEVFNGTIWSVSGALNVVSAGPAGLGSQNAALMAGGNTGAGAPTVAVNQLFNGSVWSYGANLSTAKQQASGSGSQNAGLVAGGTTGATVFLMNATELFNGSAWTASGNLSASKRGIAGSGSQNAALMAGGNTGAAASNTELHAQTIYRKLYSRDYANAKNVGILSTTNTVLLQGSTITSNYFPINKYLVLNRSLNSQLTNNTSLTSIAYTSIAGPSSNIMTYNLSATANMLSLIPGMMVSITGSATSANNGIFVIYRIINPSSIEITNSSGVAENPVTGGVLSFISSMIAVNSINPGDIVVGKTDANGILTIHKPLTISSLNRRLK